MNVMFMMRLYWHGIRLSKNKVNIWLTFYHVLSMPHKYNVYAAPVLTWLLAAHCNLVKLIASKYSIKRGEDV